MIVIGQEEPHKERHLGNEINRSQYIKKKVSDGKRDGQKR